MSAGLVSRAMNVAARPSLRRSLASSADSSLMRSPPPASAIAISPPQSRHPSTYPRYGVPEHLDFSQEDVARAARYHQPLYLAFVASVGISFAVYATLAWGDDRLWS